MAVFFGLFSLASGLVLNKLRSHGNSKSPLLHGIILASFFVVFEYASAYGFDLIWLGSGTLVGPHWTLGNLAYALADNVLALRSASIVGIYGLTFLIIIINFIFLKILIGKEKSFRHLLIVVLIIVALSLSPKLIKNNHNNHIDQGKQINFAVIQTNQPTRITETAGEKLTSFKEQLSLLSRVAKENTQTQLIIFPEASDLFKNIATFLGPSQIKAYFVNLFKGPTLIIAGTRTVGDNGLVYSRVFGLDSKDGIIDFYDKRLLAPGGEYLPYILRFAINLFSRNKTSWFDELREIAVGNNPVSSINFRNQFKVAPIICSEILSPNLINLTTRGSDIIIAMASYGIMHGNTDLAKQNLANARFRAVENNKPLIAATNMGFSYVIDRHGSIISITSHETSQILTGSLALDSNKPWYNKLGNLPILWASLLIALTISILAYVTKT